RAELHLSPAWIVGDIDLPRCIVEVKAPALHLREGGHVDKRPIIDEEILGVVAAGPLGDAAPMWVRDLLLTGRHPVAPFTLEVGEKLGTVEDRAGLADELLTVARDD